MHHWLWLGSSLLHSATQSVVVQNLSPNTRYEFVVRLHVDQTSSAWSSVAFHRTSPAGNLTPHGGSSAPLLLSYPWFLCSFDLSWIIYLDVFLIEHCCLCVQRLASLLREWEWLWSRTTPLWCRGGSPRSPTWPWRTTPSCTPPRRRG